MNTQEIQLRIKSLASSFHSQLVAVRRHLHKHPELSFQEYKTSAFIQEKLKEFGIPFQANIVKTGIVATIRGKNPEKKTIALRADIDALPINEINTNDYCSTNVGVMHACGHDVHTSCVLGAAKILNEIKDEWEGTVKFIFQPGEEKLPGGASLMIKEGVLENPKVNSIIGQHVQPSIEAGKVGFKNGLYMASTDEIYVKIKGKGGHAATPQLNIDPVLISAHIIVALQQIVSRAAQPNMPTVLSFGKVIANGATNVIPDEVSLEGTFRTFDEKWRADAHAKMKKMAEQIAESMDGSCEFNIVKGYPFLVNDEQITDDCRDWAKEYLGAENVQELDLRMTAEDFAYYSQLAKACFYRLGTGNKMKGITSNIHTPTFDVDESSIETGMGLMAWLAFREITKG